LNIGDCDIEIVDQRSHLGHVISSEGVDLYDILRCRSSFIGQVNNLLCLFNKLDSFMRNGLFKVYCSSLYGCELWTLDKRSLSDVCEGKGCEEYGGYLGMHTVTC